MSYPTCSDISGHSDCVEKDHRLRKDNERKTQYGRSMIEMLGVLAIIGVLSVGGIAGYTKAMTKYKINKTIDEITQLAQNIRAFYATQKDYESLKNNWSAVVKKAHLAPEEMWNSDGTGLEHPFGGFVGIYARGKYSGTDNKAFGIRLYDLPEEACMEILTKDWGIGSSSGFLAIGSYSEVNQSYDNYPSTNPSYINFASEGVMRLDKATMVCEASSGDVMLKFY